MADSATTAEILGDEPFQYFKKFRDIQVAVDADRKNGIEQLLNQKSRPEIILLDDAFQHRKVKAGFYILLTAYDDLFCDDFMLPTGNLRESRNGAKRANLIIVTKCPLDIAELEQQNIKNKLAVDLPIYFSSIDYDDKVYNDTESLAVSDLKLTPKILLAGIAKPKPFFDYLQTDKDEVMTFSDHHHFRESDILNIKSQAIDKIIVTTEKDFVRLDAKILRKQLFYLPIKSKFLSKHESFDQIILKYVGPSSRNR